MEDKTRDTSVLLLCQMAQEWSGQTVSQCDQLAQSGSHRRYYRITLDDGRTVIGAYNDDVDENTAFFTYTRHFATLELPVPRLLSIAPDQKHYLQNDLGTQTLYDFLCANRGKDELADAQIRAYYEQTARLLPRFQLAGKQSFDFSVAYPRKAFDRQSMHWDLSYFKYYFLKLVNVPFHEQRLEDDFQTLMDWLLTSDSEYFLYRDFQSRNIMVNPGEVFFIDYQGGRKGALQYDIASLLYDAKADLTPQFREHILSIYLESLSSHINVDIPKFRQYLQGFVLIRILQSLGAYGYRGYFERKSHFLQSIPYAAKNLRELLDNSVIPVALPELTRVLREITDSDFVQPFTPEPGLTVRVQSFSFKRGIPQDPSPNGGGFVFDCRALPNPGREPQYRTFTGQDTCVIDYLEKYPEVHQFKEHLFAMVDQAVDNYLERQFNHLMVSFGCTGGQHRSVYFAEQTALHLRERYPDVQVILQHTTR